jgi:tetratricopeptide (TPR) repeat protein
MHERIARIQRLVRSGRTQEASVLAARLVLDYAGEPRAWRERAFVRAMQGHHAASIRDMSKAIALNEFSLLDALFSRGVSSFKLRRYRLAVADFSRAIALGDIFKMKCHRIQAHFFRAECYVRLKHFKEARQDCEHVPAQYQTWTYRLRSRSELLADCRASASGNLQVRIGQRGRS